jgi:hypothetical protein
VESLLHPSDHTSDPSLSVVTRSVNRYKIVLQDVVANVAEAVKWAEEYIKDAVKDLPYTSIIIVGVSLVLPLLKNPTAVEATN